MAITQEFNGDILVAGEVLAQEVNSTGALSARAGSFIESLVVNGSITAKTGSFGTLTASFLSSTGTATNQTMSQLAITNALKENRFVVEIVYDMSSSSASINHGFPNGVKNKQEITGLDLSKYRFLIIDCQFERNLTMLMDLTEKNKPNNFYINSMVGCAELRTNFKLIGFEIIVNSEKTSIKVNNTISNASYSVSSELVPDDTAFVSKIYGIV